MTPQATAKLNTPRSNTPQTPSASKLHSPRSTASSGFRTPSSNPKSNSPRAKATSGPRVPCYVVEVPDSNPVKLSTGHPTQSAVYRSARFPDKLVDDLQETHVSNCWDLFQLGLEIGKDRPCIGTRRPNANDKETYGPYEWRTYGQVRQLALSFGRGLLNLDLVPETTFAEEPSVGATPLRCIGLFSKNREEWFVCEQAANAYGFTLVPLYDTFGLPALRHILRQTKLETIVASPECAKSIFKAVDGTPSTPVSFRAPGPSDDSTEGICLRNLILLEEYTPADIPRPNDSPPRGATQISDELKGSARMTGMRIVNWREVVQSGFTEETKDDFKSAAGRESIQTICYTSGTTGYPKGVIVTHHNIIAIVCASLRGPFSEAEIVITQEECHISYLPLAHCFERVIGNLVLAKGARVGCYTGNILSLLSDIRELKPTVFVSVPRLFTRINDKITAGLQTKSRLSRYLFETATASKLASLKANPSCFTHRLWDRMIFGKIQALLGGQVRYLLVGGAPLDPEIQNRMKVFFSAPLLEGYGLTECMGAGCHSRPRDPSGYVGSPMPSIEIRLESVPAMGYDIKDNPPRGELLIRGPSVTPGYFLAPKETEELFAEGCWMRSGDIVEMTKEGLIRLIDRKKNLFKLSQGEYVAPERLEGVYQQAALVLQVFVFGYPTKAFLIAIVVPDPDGIEQWMQRKEDSRSQEMGRHSGKKASLEVPTIEELCDESKHPEFKRAVFGQLQHQANRSGLKGFEHVRAVYLTPEPFSVENHLLTPTMKLRRHEAYQRFKPCIDALCEAVEKEMRVRV